MGSGLALLLEFNIRICGCKKEDEELSKLFVLSVSINYRHAGRLSKSQGYFVDLSPSAYKGTIGLEATKSEQWCAIFDVLRTINVCIYICSVCFLLFLRSRYHDFFDSLKSGENSPLFILKILELFETSAVK